MSNLLVFDIAVYDSSGAYVIFVISVTWDCAVVLVPIKGMVHLNIRIIS